MSASIECGDASGVGVGRMAASDTAEMTKLAASTTRAQGDPIVEAITPPTTGPRSPPSSVPARRLSELAAVKSPAAMISGSRAVEAG